MRTHRGIVISRHRHRYRNLKCPSLYAVQLDKSSQNGLILACKKRKLDRTKRHAKRKPTQVPNSKRNVCITWVIQDFNRSCQSCGI